MDKKEFVDVLYGRIYSIAVIDDVRSEDTSTPDPDDSWDRANTSSTHNITGFNAALETEDKYFDLVVPFEPQFEETYHLLYAVYSTGDSFGHDEGRGIEHIGFYKEDQLHIANENRAKIERHKRDDNDEFSIKLREPNGSKMFEQHTPWSGYFERLDYCDVIEIRRET